MILIFELVNCDVDPFVGVAGEQCVPTFDVAEWPRRTLNDQMSLLGALFEALRIEHQKYPFSCNPDWFPITEFSTR